MKARIGTLGKLDCLYSKKKVFSFVTCFRGGLILSLPLLLSLELHQLGFPSIRSCLGLRKRPKGIQWGPKWGFTGSLLVKTKNRLWTRSVFFPQGSKFVLLTRSWLLKLLPTSNKQKFLTKANDAIIQNHHQKFLFVADVDVKKVASNATKITSSLLAYHQLNWKIQFCWTLLIRAF